jgi:glycosyltransferase involved in cell wall biosynthesis
MKTACELHKLRKNTESYPVLSIIIPAFNEERTIRVVLDRVKRTLKNLPEGFEIIVVDDGSTDMTLEIAQTVGIKVIKKGSTAGYGSALKTGLFQAKGRYLAFLDADNTYPPESIPLMLREARNGYLVVGSRFLGRQNNMSLIRKFGNVFFAILTTFFTGKHVTDTGTGLRVFGRPILKILKDLPDGLDFTPAMTLKAILSGFPYKEIPISYGQRDGNSKLHIVNDGWRFLTAIIGTFANHRLRRDI